MDGPRRLLCVRRHRHDGSRDQEILERRLPFYFLFFCESCALDKIDDRRRRVTKLFTGFPGRLEVFTLFVGVLREIGLRISLHEWHIHSPPCDSEEWEPDQFLFEEEFQEWNSAVRELYG